MNEFMMFMALLLVPVSECTIIVSPALEWVGQGLGREMLA
jgi:hypothetical protein